jgi:hypothetical protein
MAYVMVLVLVVAIVGAAVWAVMGTQRRRLGMSKAEAAQRDGDPQDQPAVTSATSKPPTNPEAPVPGSATRRTAQGRK